jgi:hypothetical protein
LIGLTVGDYATNYGSTFPAAGGRDDSGRFDVGGGKYWGSSVIVDYDATSYLDLSTSWLYLSVIAQASYNGAFSVRCLLDE